MQISHLEPTTVELSSNITILSVFLNIAYLFVFFLFFFCRKSMINDARKLASHPITYININGTLYRSKADCLFPARCQGVEHFLLKLSSKLPDFEIVLNNHDWPYAKK